MVLGKTRRVHFVGVGGIGMSGIAELLANVGYDVRGSDVRGSDTTARLAGLGVRVHEGHDAAHVADADVVVYSSAVRADNPELVHARAHRIPVIPRAEMLAELMRLRIGIAVAGAHGKTSTTSMIALVLRHAGLDPTAIIGGRLSAFGSNARLGRGDYMVAEADESDRSFLKLSPAIAVLTNIDREHMEAYGTYRELQDAFVEFANKVPFYGVIVMCADDVELAAVRGRFSRRVVDFGLGSRTADVRATDVVLEGFGSRTTVEGRRATGAEREPLGVLHLKVPGRHSVQNALAAVAVGLELDIPFETVAAALAEFTGAERRFQVLGTAGEVTVVDDYGHHPTEIAAVIDAARAARPARILVAFQPHRYSRTRDLLDEFAAVLALPDELVLTDIYAAGEDALPGVTSEVLAARIDARRVRPAHRVGAVGEVTPLMTTLVRPGDLVITLGAGSIGTVAPALLAALRSNHEGVH